MRKKAKLVLCAGWAGAALLVVIARAHAESEQSDSTSIAEVVVTAQKKTERLLDVPASVTAVTAVDLQGIGATSLDDYVKRIPGLTVSNLSAVTGSTQVTLRGITTGPGGNPTVGIYVDDSPFGLSTGFGAYTVPDLDPQDLARVEVLRGPQGTLYGAGSLGGLIKYVTAAPDPTAFFGRAEVDGSKTEGGSGGYGVRASANIPLSEDMALRVSGYDRQDPGYVDNVLTGQRDINENHFSGGRISLGWQANEDWKARLSAMYQYQSGAGPLVDYSPTTFKPTYGDLTQSDAIGSGADTQRLAQYSLNVEGKLGDFATLTSATAYGTERSDFSVDFTKLLQPLLTGVFGIPAQDAGGVLRQPLSVNKLTEELRLASPTNNTVSWLLGGFFTHENSLTNALLSPLNPMTGVPITGIPLLGSSAGDHTFEEHAVFGDATYHFSPAFDITAGIRYGSNKQYGHSATSGLLYGVSPGPLVKSDDSSVTYLVTPSFHLTQDTMFYARFATGYRPGGSNSTIAGTPPSFGPDQVKNYEVGVKSELLDRRLSLEASAYLINWTDIQVQEVNPFGSYIGNGATARSQGVEASAFWHPLPGLQLYGNLAYQDAYASKDFPPGGAIANSGDRLPLTPLWSGALGADYSFPLFAQWSGKVGADAHHVGETLGAFPNPGAVRFVHPEYNVYDLRTGINNQRWTLTLFAKNIGDARGQTADVLLGPTQRVPVIQPRTFEISLSTTF